MITDVRDITSFKWGTLKGVNPISVQLDGDTAPLALIPDSLVDPRSLSVNDRVRVELSLRKVVIHGVSAGKGTAFPGELRAVAFSTAPSGWMMAQGQSLLRAEYPELFAAIGTTYGAADATHFNLPNLKGRTIIGRDSAQTEFDVLGETGGAKTHSHPLSSAGQALITMILGTGAGIFMRRVATATWNATHGVTSVAPAGNTSSTTVGAELDGDTDAASSLPPYLVVNYMIKL